MTNIMEQAERVVRTMEMSEIEGPGIGGEPGEFLAIKGLHIIAIFQACCISCAEKIRRRSYPSSDCLGVRIPPEDAEGECIEETLRRLGE